MSNPKNDANDAYNEMLRSFSNVKKSESSGASGDEVKNHGEIYFSANSGRSAQRRQKPHSSRNSAAGRKSVSATAKPARKKTVRKSKKQSRMQSAILAAAVCGFVFLGAFLVRIPLMGCINDILAIDVSTTDYRVILGEGKKVDDVIDILAKQKLINNPGFCKLFTSIMGYDKDKSYPAGTYFLSSDMGIEGMLYKIKTSGIDSNTIKLTFPEGYTVEEIVSKLSDNGVASKDGLYKAMKSDELFEKFDFLKDITDKQLRLHALEGYLFPDTYEFYIGEDPESVIERFLKNFNDRWNSNYADRARELGLSVDEVMNIASIIQMEAFNAEQMPVISSVIHNRLDAPARFPFINCDSTGDYIEDYKEKLQAEGTYANYLSVYDTYQKTGLPVGPISSPGEDAIHAALYPSSSDYYYFLHAPDGKIYLGKTEAEHEVNKQHLG